MTAIKVELELVDGSFTTRMLHAGETIEQFNRNVARSSPVLRKMAADGQMVIRSMEKAQEAGRGFLSTLRDVSIVTTAVSVGFNKIINVQDTWVGAVVRTNAEFERLTHMLRSMSTAADPVADAANQVKGLVDMAKEAPFSLDNLTASFTKLKATGTDPMKGSLKAILDGVAAFGGDGQALERTVLGISQASGKGVIQMEELRQQIGESMPQAMTLMAASMGVSMAQLIKHISTGRMAAQPSLEAFYQELDRSFGGSASRMMQTFTGQLARTMTELQGFAQIIGDVDASTGNAREGGFFYTVTEQVRELNQALASPGGQVFAQQIGQALASIATGLQTVIEKAIEFRSAIYNAAEFAAWVVGLKVAASVMTSVGAGFQALRTGLDMIKLKFADANTMLSAHQAALRNTAVGYESVDRLAQMAARTGLRALASAAMGLVPVAGVLGLAIYEIADAFDVFGSRGKEAINTLREFGNLARDQLGAAQKNIDGRAADLLKDKQSINQRVKGFTSFGSKETKDANRDAYRKQLEAEYDIEKRTAELEQDRFKIKEATIKLAESDAKNAAELRLRDMDREEAAEQRAYQTRREEIQKEYDAKVDAAKQAKGDIDAIEKQRAEALMNNAADLYKEQQSRLQEAVNNLWKSNGTGPMQLTKQIELDELLKKIDQVREKTSNLKINGILPDVGNTSNSVKQLENLQKVFDRTNEDVQGLEDKLKGGNDELGEFLAKLARGAYGNTSNQQVQELAGSIELLLKKKAALEEMDKSATDVQNDIEAARIKLVEERMALEEKALGRELTEGEKIERRINSGAYPGLTGNSPAMQALQDAIKGLTVQGRVTDALGQSIDQTFGQTAVSKVTTLNDVLSKTLGIVTGIGTGVNGIDFSGMSSGLGNSSAFMGGAAPRITRFSGSTLDLIGKGESGGDYNATLDHGAWTGGPQNLVGMTLNEVRNLQRMMLANPGNRAKYGDGKGSSALGKYQIVGSTLEGLMKEMGLMGNEKFDEAMQDKMAMHLLNRRLASGEGLTGLRKEWTSLRNVSDDVLTSTLQGANRGPTRDKAAGLQAPALDMNRSFDIRNPYAASATSDTSAAYAEGNAYLEARNRLLNTALEATHALTKEENQLNDDEKQQAAVDKKTELVRMIDEAKDSLDGLDKNYRAVSKLIASGKLGGGKGPEALETDQAKELLKLARELDAAEKSRADKKQAAGNIENNNIKFKEQELQIARQIEQLKAKAKDPNVKLESDGLVQLREQMDTHLRDLETVYGKDSTLYKEGLEKKRQALAMFGQTELLTDVANSNAKTKEIQRGLMTETASRQAAMQQELAEVDARIAYYRNAGQLDVQATEQFEGEKAAIRAKYASQDPMAKQMKEWGNLQDNLAQASTQWTDSIADGLTGLISGTGDLKSALQSLQQVASSIINIFVKKALSGLMGPKTGAAGGAGKAAKGGNKAIGFSGANTTLGAMLGAAHGGAILGRGVSMTRMVNPAVFKNARKFHSGANAIGGRRLLPGEIPIIAKKDEGIFTKEQMQAIGSNMGSGQVNTISINAPVSVNANGGTPEQNNDLAKQISYQIEDTMRGVVVDEITKQMKPGNMLSKGKGR